MRLFDDANDATRLAGTITGALPTHSHWAWALLHREAKLKPGLSVAASNYLEQVAVASTTPKYLALCHFNDAGKMDVCSQLALDFGRNAEAVRALIWASLQKPYWRLWRKSVTWNLRRQYPALAANEWQ